MERIELRAKPGRLILLNLGALAFVILSALFIYNPAVFTLYPPLFARALGVVGVLFFGACLVSGIAKLRNRGPHITLSDEGLSVAALNTPLIPWSDILEARIVTVRRSSFISLRLLDEHSRIAALSAHRRRVAKANLALGYGAFNVSTITLGVPAEWLMSEMQQRVDAFGDPFAQR